MSYTAIEKMRKENKKRFGKDRIMERQERGT